MQDAAFKMLDKVSSGHLHNTKLIESCDYAILCPGGFIHEYYDYIATLKPIINYLETKSVKTFIISQSVGPFSSEPQDARWLLSKIETILLREENSFNFIEKLGDNSILSKTKVTSDIALGYTPKNSNKHYIIERDSETIFLNFRGWHEWTTESLIEKAKTIVVQCLNNGYKVEFLSTCQSVPSYTDDSVLHYQIVESLLQEDMRLRDSIAINSARYSPSELIKYLSSKCRYY